MRICYLNYDGIPTIQAGGDKRVGGLNTIIFNLSTKIASLPETETVVVCRRDSAESPVIERNKNWELVRITVGPQQQLTREKLENLLQEFAEVFQLYLQQFQPDVIHTSGSESGEIMLRLRALGRAREIPWVHTNYATLVVRRVIVENKNINEALGDEVGKRENLCLHACDHVIALSDVDKREIGQIFGLSPVKTTVVMPGIDEGIFYPGIDDPRQPIVISAGRMSRIKDFPFLLRAFKSAIILPGNLNANLKLQIIGGNEEEKNALGLPQLIKKLRLDDHVELLDAVSHHQLADYFRRAKVFAGTSQHETFGLLPVEARACGTPFVVRANSSYLATAADGYGGYFSVNKSEVDMARKISRIINFSHEEWQKMSDQAVHSTENFRWTATAQSCLAVYRQIINQKRGVLAQL